jgi:hypothetical protein
MLTAFAETYDSWGDMTALLAHETWPADKPCSLAYFCGCLQMPAGSVNEQIMLSLVQSQGTAWLDTTDPGRGENASSGRSRPQGKRGGRHVIPL